MSIESACSLSEYRNFSNSSPESKRLWKDLPSAVIATTMQFHDLFTIEDYRGKELAVSAVCCLQTLRTNCNSGNEFFQKHDLRRCTIWWRHPLPSDFLLQNPWLTYKYQKSLRLLYAPSWSRYLISSFPFHRESTSEWCYPGCPSKI